MRNIGLHQEGRYFYRRIIFLVFLSAIFADSAFGQNLYQTVKGKVLDKTLQTTLPGANIVILKTNPPIGAMTDNDGTYKIEKVPIGRYDVQASYIGYEPMVIKEVVIGSGKEVVLNFELKESIIDLDAVEVKAGRYDRQAKSRKLFFKDGIRHRPG
ncbi:MAG TPA: carboxypeptidase-like regulatory domain-containing protein [Ignavibacteriales bacterium]|nr:carboxypeptidase-like regulatory domain-containing protein [Ignavibacteriales bacterium]